MDNFITLLCPTCGGSLQVGLNAGFLICKHCGNSHIVRREGSNVNLESFACCPRCGRNDKSEKVSAIIRRDKQEINGLQQITNKPDGTKLVQDVFVPTRQTSISNLAQSLMPPAKPKNLPKPHPEMLKENNWFIGLVSILMLSIPIIIGLIGILLESPSSYFEFSVIIVILLVIFGFLFYKSIRVKGELTKLNEQIKLKNKQAEENWHMENQQHLEPWEKAIQRWDNLYYCQRDDCVFVPDEGTWASVTNMEEYLYQ